MWQFIRHPPHTKQSVRWPGWPHHHYQISYGIGEVTNICTHQVASMDFYSGVICWLVRDNLLETCVRICTVHTRLLPCSKYIMLEYSFTISTYHGWLISVFPTPLKQDYLEICIGSWRRVLGIDKWIWQDVYIYCSCGVGRGFILESPHFECPTQLRLMERVLVSSTYFSLHYEQFFTLFYFAICWLFLQL